MGTACAMTLEMGRDELVRHICKPSEDLEAATDPLAPRFGAHRNQVSPHTSILYPAVWGRHYTYKPACSHQIQLAHINFMYIDPLSTSNSGLECKFL